MIERNREGTVIDVLWDGIENVGKEILGEGGIGGAVYETIEQSGKAFFNCANNVGREIENFFRW